MESGAAEGTRTPDPIITNDVLYQLSYSGTFLPDLLGCRDFGVKPACQTDQGVFAHRQQVRHQSGRGCVTSASMMSASSGGGAGSAGAAG